MGKKKERAFATADEELLFLRRHSAGLKGMNALLTKQKEDLNRCLDESRDEIIRNEKLISGLESQVSDLSGAIALYKKELNALQDELSPLKANVEYYNNLPWIVKMFTFRIP